MEYAQPSGVSVYVAAKFDDRERVRALQTKLRQAGYTITHDWTAHEANLADKTRAQFQEDAKRDRAGIQAADVVIFIMDDVEYAFRGTFYEMGYADALYRHVVILTPYAVDAPVKEGFRRCCFYHLDEHTVVATEDALLAHLATAVELRTTLQ